MRDLILKRLEAISNETADAFCAANSPNVAEIELHNSIVRGVMVF